MQYELSRGLLLRLSHQIDHADGIGAGLAVLQCEAVGLGLLHEMAMSHRVGGGIRELVLHTLCPTYGRRGLCQEQHEQ